MFSTDVLDQVELQVDYLLTDALIAEKGGNLKYVNRYELCAEKDESIGLTQDEWWPFVHCAFTYQGCLFYNSTDDADSEAMTCALAATGAKGNQNSPGPSMELDGGDGGDGGAGGGGGDAKKKKAMAGTRRLPSDDSCDCSMEGVMSFCAEQYTSTTIDALNECVYEGDGETLQKASADWANNIADGKPDWVIINNETVANNNDDPGTDGDDQTVYYEPWAETVLSDICTTLSDNGLTVPSGCD